jgi:hypothetical protein
MKANKQNRKFDLIASRSDGFGLAPPDYLWTINHKPIYERRKTKQQHKPNRYERRWWIRIANNGISENGNEFFIWEDNLCQSTLPC